MVVKACTEDLPRNGTKAEEERWTYPE